MFDEKYKGLDIKRKNCFSFSQILPMWNQPSMNLKYVLIIVNNFGTTLTFNEGEV